MYIAIADMNKIVCLCMYSSRTLLNLICAAYTFLHNYIIT